MYLLPLPPTQPNLSFFFRWIFFKRLVFTAVRLNSHQMTSAIVHPAPPSTPKLCLDLQETALGGCGDWANKIAGPLKTGTINIYAVVSAGP